MKKKVYVYFLGACIFLILLLTNPSKDDFEQYISNYIREYALQISADNDTANLASGIAFLILQSNSVIKHDNYIVLSRFRIDTSVIRSFGYNVDDIIVLGLFNKFIPIDGVQQNIM